MRRQLPSSFKIRDSIDKGIDAAGGEGYFSSLGTTEEEAIGGETVIARTMEEETIKEEAVNVRTMEEKTIKEEAINARVMEEESIEGEAVNARIMEEETIKEEAVNARTMEGEAPNARTREEGLYSNRGRVKATD